MKEILKERIKQLENNLKTHNLEDVKYRRRHTSIIRIKMRLEECKYLLKKLNKKYLKQGGK